MFLESLSSFTHLLPFYGTLQEKEDLERRIDLFQRKVDDLSKDMDDRVSENCRNERFASVAS